MTPPHKTATFVFEPEHYSLILEKKFLGDLIKNLCEDCFGIKRERVVFTRGDIKAYLTDKGRVVYCDTDTKLAALKVTGFEPKQVETNTDNLDSVVAGMLQDFDCCLKLPSDARNVKVLEVIRGCTLIVLCLSSGTFLALLCAMGDRKRRSKFSECLQQVLPGCGKMAVTLGGLPPLELFINSAIEVESLSKDEGTVTMFQFVCCFEKSDPGNGCMLICNYLLINYVASLLSWLLASLGKHSQLLQFILVGCTVETFAS